MRKPSSNNSEQGESSMESIPSASGPCVEELIGYRAPVNLEERYRALIDSIADGYYEVDIQGNFTVASTYMERLGYLASEIRGMNFGAFITKENYKLVFQAFHEVFKTGKPIKNLEFDLTTKGGEEKTVSISSAPIKDEAGQVIGFRGIFQDITELVEPENLLLEISRTSPIGIYALESGKFIYANQAFLKLSGYAKNELIGIKPGLLVHPEDWQRVRNKAVTMLKGQVCPPYEFRLIRKDGQIIWVMESLWSIRLRGKKLAFGSILDINPLKKTELALRQSEERYRTIIENIQEGYYEADEAGRIIFINDAFGKILGYEREELQNKEFTKLSSADHLEELKEKLKIIRETGQPNPSIEWGAVTKDGLLIFTELSATPMRDETGTLVGFRGILRDTTERREREQAIKQLAYYDPLTGLPNRRLFEDRFNLALANASRQESMLALLVIDLDNFKEINDNYGHDAGDSLLREIGSRLSDLLRKGDSVARIGGDEFMVLLPNTHRRNDIAVVANKILAAIEQSFQLGGEPIRVAASIGISIYPEHGSDKIALTRQADRAMYQAKRTGNSYKFFSPVPVKKKPMTAKKPKQDLRQATRNINRRKTASAPSNTSPPGARGQPDDRGQHQES